MIGNSINDIYTTKIPNTYGKPSPAYMDSAYGSPEIGNNLGNNPGARMGMMGAAGMGGPGMTGINPRIFYFNGSSLSLRAIIQSYSDAEI